MSNDYKEKMSNEYQVSKVIIANEVSFLVCSMAQFFSRYIYIYMYLEKIYMFQAVHRAINVLNVSTCI